MPKPIVISYARTTSADQAKNLFDELGGSPGLAFLDTSDIEAGDQFPTALAEAILASRVMVLFLDESYFNRWYCLKELELALTPFMSLPSSHGQQAAVDSVSHIVIAMPPTGASTLLSQLPPVIRTTQWPRAADTEAVARLARQRVDRDRTLADRIGAERALQLQKRLEHEAALPPPSSLVGTLLFPATLNPSYESAFVGRRRDLWRLNYLLNLTPQGAANPGMVAIQAGGGFGKSRLALEYVHRFAGSRAGGVIWIDAQSAADEPRQQLHAVLRGLHPDVPDLAAYQPDGRSLHGDLREALLARSRVERGQPLLYVVDGPPEPPAGISPEPIDKWCPATDAVKVIVTGRWNWGVQGPSVRVLEIDVLEREASVLLLTRDVPRSTGDEADWTDVAAWVGDLPLALELLNRTLVAGAVTAQEVFEMSRQDSVATSLDEQAEVLRSLVPQNAVRGITDTFQLSYSRLSDAGRSVMEVLAQLADHVIPLALLQELGANFWAQDVRAELRSRYFVGPPSGSSDVFGRVHRVIAAFIRSQMRDEQSAVTRAASAITQLLPRDPARLDTDWSQLRDIVPHAEHILGRCVSTGAPRNVRLDLGARTARLLLRFGDPGRARVLLELALADEPETGPISLPSAGDALGAYAYALRLLGFFQDSLRVSERLVAHLGRVAPRSEALLKAKHNLAVTLMALERFAEAESLFVAVIDAREDDPSNGESNLLTLGMLGRAIHNQGRADEAIAMQRRVLDGQTRLLTPTHPDRIATAGSLGLALQRRWVDLEPSSKRTTALQEARSLLASAREAFTLSFGEDHRETQTVTNSLAAALRALGKLAEAEALLIPLLSTRRRTHGISHDDIVQTMSDLAYVWTCQARYENAIGLLREAVSVRPAAVHKTLKASTIAINLAYVLARAGRAPEAQSVCNQQLAWLIDSDPADLPPPLRNVRTKAISVCPGIERIQ